MTSKDLNLTLDQRLAPPREAAHQPPPGEVPGTGQRTPQGAAGKVAAASRRPAANAAPGRGVPVITVLLIVLVNTLFLAAAGYWLSYRLDSQVVPASGASPGLELALATMGEDLAALDTRVQDLQLTLREHQQLMASAHLDLQASVQAAAVDRENTAQAPAAAAPEPAADTWVINAGTFHSRGEAERLQSQLLDLGQRAQIHSAGSGEGQTHRLLIAGYADRGAAEQAAQRLMASTELNGLWVWKDQ